MFFELTTHQVFAQKKTDLSDTSLLNEIVITSNRTATRLGNVAVPTKLISDQYIKQTGSLKLQDVLQEFTGITVVNSALSTSLNGYPNPFGQGVQMLGLDPAYTAVLLDGEPLIGRNAGILKLGRLATGNIKQIEIVKGPSSSLYGSEAMAGVINIVTQPALSENFESQVHTASNNTNAQTISYSNRLQKTGLQLFANRYSTGGYDLDPATYGKTIDPYRDLNLQTKITHQFSARTDLLISARAFDSKQQNDYQITWQSNPSNVKGYTKEYEQSLFTQLTIKSAGNQKIYFRNFINRYRNQSFVNLVNTDTRFDETSFDQTITKPEIQFEKKSANHTFITGAGIYLESIDASRYAGKQKLQTYYVFSQSEWKLYKDKLTMIGGIRMDKRNDYALNLSPRVAIAYKPSSSLKLTASAGYGFKAPDFRHMYLNFYNAQIGYSLIGANVLSDVLTRLQTQGELEAGSDIQPFQKKTTLLPEKSVGSHAGVSYQKNKWLIQVGIFRNDIRNLIDVYLLPVQKTNNRQLYSYRNINRIYTQGLELDASFKINKNFTFSAGYQYLEAKDKDVLDKIRAGKLYKRDPETYVTSQVKKGDYFGLNNRSKHQFNAKITWVNEQRGWNVFLRGMYRGDYGFRDINGNAVADDPREMVNGFWIVNANISKAYNNGISVQTGIDNIFNYTNYLQMPNIAGRLYFMNLNYTFQHKIKKNKKPL